MRRIASALALALLLGASGGCVRVDAYASSPLMILPMPQVGVIVGVTNMCSPYISLYRAGEPVLLNIPYGTSVRVALGTAAFTGPSRKVTLTIQILDANRVPLWADDKEWYVSTYEGSREENIVVSQRDGHYRCDR